MADNENKSTTQDKISIVTDQTMLDTSGPIHNLNEIPTLSIDDLVDLNNGIDLTNYGSTNQTTQFTITGMNGTGALSGPQGSIYNLAGAVGASATAQWGYYTPGTAIPGKLEVGEDILVDGVSFKSVMSSIEDIKDRLNILTPKPELLEKYKALREAYEHYKTLEALVKNAKDDPPR